MKKQFFETETDGFYATYYENPASADCAVIGLFGDDPNDYMAKCGAKWLHRNGVNVSRKEKLQPCQLSAGTHRVRDPLAESTRKPEDRHYGNEHNGHGRACRRIAFPIGLKFVMRFVFKAAKDYPKECEATRKDVDRKVSAALKEWIRK